MEKVVAYSRRLSNTKAAVPVKRVWRDLTLHFFLKLFASKEAHAWMYLYHIDF